MTTYATICHCALFLFEEDPALPEDTMCDLCVSPVEVRQYKHLTTPEEHPGLRQDALIGVWNRDGEF